MVSDDGNARVAPMEPLEDGFRIAQEGARISTARAFERPPSWRSAQSSGGLRCLRPSSTLAPRGVRTLPTTRAWSCAEDVTRERVASSREDPPVTGTDVGASRESARSGARVANGDRRDRSRLCLTFDKNDATTTRPEMVVYRPDMSQNGSSVYGITIQEPCIISKESVNDRVVVSSCWVWDGLLCMCASVVRPFGVKQFYE